MKLPCGWTIFSITSSWVNPPLSATKSIHRESSFGSVKTNELILNDLIGPGGCRGSCQCSWSGHEAWLFLVRQELQSMHKPDVMHHQRRVPPDPMISWTRGHPPKHEQVDPGVEVDLVVMRVRGLPLRPLTPPHQRCISRRRKNLADAVEERIQALTRLVGSVVALAPHLARSGGASPPCIASTKATSSMLFGARRQSQRGGDHEL